jgi:signal transduction histidine kinase
VCAEGVSGRAERELRDSLEELALANEERGLLLAALLDAHESERRAIAAEIHDDSVQVMSAVSLRLEGLEGMLAGQAEAETLAQLRATVKEATARLRNLLFTLWPPELEVGLGAAIGAFALPLAADHGLVATVDAHLPDEPPVEARMLLYRVAQEALLNVAKHAHARNVFVSLSDEDGRLVLWVADDGIGSDPARLARPDRGHLGISAMRHRMELHGGTCVVRPREGGGTVVEATLPRPRPPAAG